MRFRVLASVALMCACKTTPQPSEKPVPPALEARIERPDGGGARLVIGKAASIPLTADEADGIVVTDDTRVAVRARRGGFRVLHAVGDRFLSGPSLQPDWKAATFEVEGRSLYSTHTDARAALFAEARKRGGDDAVSGLLARTIDLADPSWKGAEASLPDDKKKRVHSEIRAALETRSPPDALLGAILEVELADKGVVGLLGPRIAELAKQKIVPHPRALGAMLRALARERPDEAAKLGCEILAAGPESAREAMGDAGGISPLLEGALLSIAHAKLVCTTAILKVLGDERCHPSFRCGPGGARVDPRTASDQTEPLCTSAELAPEVEKELARAKAEVMKIEPPWTERWALAALASTDSVPAPWKTAHERRRYAITQPKSPECGEGPLGAACHCDEATLRDQACRTDSSPVTVAFCRFEVDGAKRLISNVTYPSP